MKRAVLGYVNFTMGTGRWYSILKDRKELCETPMSRPGSGNACYRVLLGFLKDCTHGKHAEFESAEGGLCPLLFGIPLP